MMYQMFQWFVDNLPSNILDVVYTYNSPYKILKDYDDKQFNIFLMFESSNLDDDNIKATLPEIYDEMYRSERRWKILYDIEIIRSACQDVPSDVIQSEIWTPIWPKMYQQSGGELVQIQTCLIQNSNI